MPRDDKTKISTTLEPDFRCCGDPLKRRHFNPHQLAAQGVKEIYVESYGTIDLSAIAADTTADVDVDEGEIFEEDDTSNGLDEECVYEDDDAEQSERSVSPGEDDDEDEEMAAEIAEFIAGLESCFEGGEDLELIDFVTEGNAEQGVRADTANGCVCEDDVEGREVCEDDAKQSERSVKGGYVEEQEALEDDKTAEANAAKEEERLAKVAERSTAWRHAWEKYSRYVGLDDAQLDSQTVTFLLHPTTLPPAWWLVFSDYKSCFSCRPRNFGELVRQATAVEDWPTVCQLLVEWSLAVNMLKGGWDVDGFLQCSEEQRCWLGRHLLRFRVVGTPFYDYAEGESIHDYFSGFFKKRDMEKGMHHCVYWHHGAKSPRPHPNYATDPQPDEQITALHVVTDYGNVHDFVSELFRKFPRLQWIAYDCENCEAGVGMVWTETDVGVDVLRQWDADRLAAGEMRQRCEVFMKSPRCPPSPPPLEQEEGRDVGGGDWVAQHKTREKACRQHYIDYATKIDAALASEGLTRPPDCPIRTAKHPHGLSGACRCSNRPPLHPRWRAFGDGTDARHLCRRADLPESYFIDTPRDYNAGCQGCGRCYCCTTCP